MIVFNSLTVAGEDFSELQELDKMTPIAEYGLTRDFYGGQVQYIGYVKGSKFLQLISGDGDGLSVVDTGIENPRELSLDKIKLIAKEKEIEVKAVTSKQEIIDDMIKACKVLSVERSEPIQDDVSVNLKVAE